MRLTADERLALEGMQLSKVGRKLLAMAEQGFDVGIRPRTATEAWRSPPVQRNPYKGRPKK